VGADAASPLQDLSWGAWEKQKAKMCKNSLKQPKAARISFLPSPGFKKFDPK